MKDKIYFVQNRLSNRFGEPFGCASDAVAVKRVKNALPNNDNEFDLFLIAEYDLETGEVSLLPRVRIPLTDSTISSIEKDMAENGKQT